MEKLEANNKTYVEINWEHSYEDYPYKFLLELGADRFELRRIVFNKDGTTVIADQRKSINIDELGEKPFPSIADYNKLNDDGDDSERISAKSISKESFEYEWNIQSE